MFPIGSVGKILTKASLKKFGERLFYTPTKTLRIAWKVLGFFIAVNAFGICLDLLLRALNKGKPLFLPFRSGDALVALGATLLVLRLEGRSLASIGLKLNRQFFIQLFFGAVAAILMVLLTTSPILLMDGFGFPSGLGLKVLLSGLATALGISIFEEGLFRGYAFQKLIEGLGPWKAQAVFALLFALPHLVGRNIPAPMRFAVVINAAMVAILLGAAFLKTRSLAASIGWHWAWNWTLGPLLGFSVSGHVFPSLLIAKNGELPSALSGGGFGPEASLTFTLIGLLALLLLARAPNSPLHPDQAAHGPKFWER